MGAIARLLLAYFLLTHPDSAALGKFAAACPAPRVPMVAKQAREDAGVLEPGKTKPPPSAGSSAESGWEPPAEVNFKGSSSSRPKHVDSAAVMRQLAGVKSQERKRQLTAAADVDDALDRESLNQSWSQWFMYGTSAPVGLIRHSVMSSIYDKEAVRKLVFPRSYCNSAFKGQSHFRRSMSVLDAEYPVLNASGSGVDVTIGYRLYPFRRCAARTAVLLHTHLHLHIRPSATTSVPPPPPPPAPADLLTPPPPLVCASGKVPRAP
jgi:hypothetical protein